MIAPHKNNRFCKRKGCNILLAHGSTYCHLHADALTQGGGCKRLVPRDDAARMIEAGISFDEVAAKYNVTVGTIRRAVKQHHGELA